MEVVADDRGILIFIQHVQVAVVIGVRVARVRAINLDSLIDAITWSVHCQSLARITDTEVFLVLASIHLDK